jgi:eukaryotic-like serine/threonine-protein kinase
MHDATILPLGTWFHGRYRTLGCIKAGGMGAVYEVEDAVTGRRRALKVMHPDLVGDGDLVARFAREARFPSAIDCDHVVEVFDAGVDGATRIPFLVMELLRGEDLATRAARGPMQVADVLELLAQAATAIDGLHAAGVVHRDIKPDNLFVARRQDGSMRLKVLDFGVAKVFAASGICSTRSLGTPLYMAPEQVQQSPRIGRAMDVYALGHVAFTLLVGEAYFTQEARRSTPLRPLLLEVRAGASEAASTRAAKRGVTLPLAFDAWFARATCRDPERRFRSAAELVASLRAVFASASAAPGGTVAMRREAKPPVQAALPAAGRPPAQPEQVAPAVPEDTVAGPPKHSLRPLLAALALALGAVLAMAAWAYAAPEAAATPAHPRGTAAAP